MTDAKDRPGTTETCLARADTNLSAVKVIRLKSEPAMVDYRQAMAMANNEAAQCLGEPMPRSWYDRDRYFESPQHTSEYHVNRAIPGNVNYDLSHGAS